MNELKTVGTVNGVGILSLENGNRMIPIRPICEALGIDEEAQRQKIEADEDLNSVAVLSKATGADGKEYNMKCIPLKYVFGWLFTINPKNVKPEAKEAVQKYRRICYDVLYSYFQDMADFMEQKQVAVDQCIEEVDGLRMNFKNAKEKMDAAKKKLDSARKMSIDEWKANGRQMNLFE